MYTILFAFLTLHFTLVLVAILHYIPTGCLNVARYGRSQVLANLLLLTAFPALYITLYWLLRNSPGWGENKRTYGGDPEC